MTRRIVMRTADDGPVLHGPREAGQMFANANAGHGGGNFLERAAYVRGRIGLDVECVQMTNATPAEEYNAALGFTESARAITGTSTQCQ